jgi:hypothetical protein
MLKNLKKGFILSGVIFMTILSLPSCDKEDEPMSPDKLFRPAGFTSSTENDIAGGSMVTLSWTPIKNAAYLLELSKDSLAFTDIVQSISLERGVKEYEFTALTGRTRYSARIKSISSDPAVKDSEFAVLSFVSAP